MGTRVGGRERNAASATLGMGCGGAGRTASSTSYKTKRAPWTDAMRRTLLLVSLSTATALRPLPHAIRRPPRSLASVRMLCSEDLSKLTVPKLKERCRAAGLPVSGRKAELIARLGGANPAVAAPVPPPTPAPANSGKSLAGGLIIDELPTLPVIAIEACKS